MLKRIEPWAQASNGRSLVSLDQLSCSGPGDPYLNNILTVKKECGPLHTMITASEQFAFVWGKLRIRLRRDMTCWMRLLFIVAVIGSTHSAPALDSPHEQAQERSSAASGAPESASDAGAQPSNEVVIDGEAVGPRVRARPGEICIVCNDPVGPDDPVYLVQGQRVPVHAEEEREFLSHPRRYLMRLKPLGGALLGADSNQPGMANRAGDNRPEVSGTWIYGSLYVLLGLVFAAVCAHRALHTGYSPGAWFGLGLVFNVVAYILLRTRPQREIQAPAGVPSGLGKIAATHAPQRCPKCGAFNHPSAAKCLGCGASLSPRVESEVRRVGLHSA